MLSRREFLAFVYLRSLPSAPLRAPIQLRLLHATDVFGPEAIARDSAFEDLTAGLPFELAPPQKGRGGMLEFPCVRADGRQVGFPMVTPPTSSVAEAHAAGLRLAGTIASYRVDGTRHQAGKSAWVTLSLRGHP